MAEAFDYVIVGSGSAGAVLAARLSEDGRHSVLVLEFGGSDRSVVIQMPSALSIPMNRDRYNWGYWSEPEPHLGGRRMNVPRGKVIGGSSSINGMVYVRGAPQDFDRWECEGAAGWGYRHVLPYFRRAERREEGGDPYRGGDGALATRYGTLANPLYTAFVEAAQQAGYAATEDINGFRQEGFGRMDMTVKDGKRWSTANAYLKPALGRPNLSLVTGALAERIVFDGRRATGVAYRVGGAQRIATARREVILAAGPINSPKLLKLSGIGPAAELAAFGIDVLADRPGVGENLQDHLEFYFQFACREPITLYAAQGLLAKARIGLEWLLTGKGLGATNHFESCGFVRSGPGGGARRHPVSLPAARGDLRRQQPCLGARLPGPRRADALEVARPRPPRLGRPCGEARNPVQLHEPSRRLGGDACLRAPYARDLRAACVRALPRT